MPWDIKNAVLAHYCENDPITESFNYCLSKPGFNLEMLNYSLTKKLQ